MEFDINDFMMLLNPVNVHPIELIRNNWALVPNVPGFYAWYFRNFPEIIPIDDCVTFEDFTLLYVGIGQCSPASSQRLRGRIRNHIRGNASGSTLRLSLGCLLSEVLGIQLQLVGNGRMTFAHGEETLSEWMAENAFVVWMERAAPWEDEEELIAALSLPLNLRHNEVYAFYPVLSDLRMNARNIARGLHPLQMQAEV